MIGHRRRNERGTVTVFVISLTAALLLVAGLVHDGGRIISARRDADAVAAAAARAGAQGVDEVALRNGAGAPIFAADARARVQRYLSHTAYDGSAVVSGDTITVTVQRPQTLPLLSLAGIGSSTVTGSGTARTVRAITEQP